jgi:hypothetical protein
MDFIQNVFCLLWIMYGGELHWILLGGNAVFGLINLDRQDAWDGGQRW